MKNLYCEACGTRVYFQNSICLRCSTSIAFDLDRSEMVAVSGDQANPAYKSCRNATDYNICNWSVDVNSGYEYCNSCRLTEIIPDLSLPENLTAWSKVEEAKRRLVYNLDIIGLRPQEKSEHYPGGLIFHFLADTGESGKKRVLTGHDDGVVTLNIAEADDVERERMRTAMGEPYRTLVGHLRHEVGHYYWSLLVVGEKVQAFRNLFGDESQDYGEALERHYKEGPPSNWADHYISSYASAHPWEDWAETWAHYLHLVDSLGTAYHSRIKIEGTRESDPTFDYQNLDLRSFDSIIQNWPAIACIINSFNRSLGMPDAYPFVIPPTVVEKLRFIHDITTA